MGTGQGEGGVHEGDASVLGWGESMSRWIGFRLGAMLSRGAWRTMGLGGAGRGWAWFLVSCGARGRGGVVSGEDAPVLG